MQLKGKSHNAHNKRHNYHMTERTHAPKCPCWYMPQTWWNVSSLARNLTTTTTKTMIKTTTCNQPGEMFHHWRESQQHKSHPRLSSPIWWYFLFNTTNLMICFIIRQKPNNINAILQGDSGGHHPLSFPIGAIWWYFLLNTTNLMKCFIIG